MRRTTAEQISQRYHGRTDLFLQQRITDIQSEVSAELHSVLARLAGDAPLLVTATILRAAASRLDIAADIRVELLNRGKP